MQGTDCVKLSKKSQDIFGKIAAFYPPGPFGHINVRQSGKIRDNSRWYDLKKSKHRKKRIEWVKGMIGYMVGLHADSYRKEHGGSLVGFGKKGNGRLVTRYAEELMLLEDLDFQIETGDLVDGVEDSEAAE